jgi:GNAT superfamily N-acetyltransferase
VTIDADLASQALLDTWRHLLAYVSDGWTRDTGGALAAVTGVALPTLNDVRVSSDTVSDLLDQVGATGLPHCLQVRPIGASHLEELAAARGMVSDDDIPLMALADPRSLGALSQVEGLMIRELQPAAAGEHANVAAAGFEAPVELFGQLMTPHILTAPGVRAYLGEVDGKPVTTGLGVTLGSHVGIFNIATPPAYRGRGYGAVVTARAVCDGLEAGATWSWLQASPAGQRIYERLGFQTLERWLCWIGAG